MRSPFRSLLIFLAVCVIVGQAIISSSHKFISSTRTLIFQGNGTYDTENSVWVCIEESALCDTTATAIECKFSEWTTREYVCTIDQDLARPDDIGKTVYMTEQPGGIAAVKVGIVTEAPIISPTCAVPSNCGRSLGFLSNETNEWVLTFQGSNLPTASDADTLATAREVYVNISTGIVGARCPKLSFSYDGTSINCTLKGLAAKSLAESNVSTVTITAFGITVEGTGSEFPLYFITADPLIAGTTCTLPRCRLANTYSAPIEFAFPVSGLPPHATVDHLESFEFRPSLTSSTCSSAKLENGLLKCNFLLLPLATGTAENVTAEIRLYGMNFRVSTGLVVLPRPVVTANQFAIYRATTVTIAIAYLLDFDSDLEKDSILVATSGGGENPQACINPRPAPFRCDVVGKVGGTIGGFLFVSFRAAGITVGYTAFALIQRLPFITPSPNLMIASSASNFTLTGANFGIPGTDTTVVTVNFVNVAQFYISSDEAVITIPRVEGLPSSSDLYLVATVVVNTNDTSGSVAFGRIVADPSISNGGRTYATFTTGTRLITFTGTNFFSAPSTSSDAFLEPLYIENNLCIIQKFTDSEISCSLSTSPTAGIPHSVRLTGWGGYTLSTSVYFASIFALEPIKSSVILSSLTGSQHLTIKSSLTSFTVADITSVLLSWDGGSFECLSKTSIVLGKLVCSASASDLAGAGNKFLNASAIVGGAEVNAETIGYLHASAPSISGDPTARYSVGTRRFTFAASSMYLPTPAFNRISLVLGTSALNTYLCTGVSVTESELTCDVPEFFTDLPTGQVLVSRIVSNTYDSGQLTATVNVGSVATPIKIKIQIDAGAPATDDMLQNLTSTLLTNFGLTGMKEIRAARGFAPFFTSKRATFFIDVTFFGLAAIDYAETHQNTPAFKDALFSAVESSIPGATATELNPLAVPVMPPQANSRAPTEASIDHAPANMVADNGHVGIIVGVVIGCVAFIALCVIVYFVFVRKINNPRAGGAGGAGGARPSANVRSTDTVGVALDEELQEPESKATIADPWEDNANPMYGDIKNDSEEEDEDSSGQEEEDTSASSSSSQYSSEP